MSLRPVATLGAASILAAATFLSPAIHSTHPASAAGEIATVQASALNCSMAATAPFSQTQGGASTPVCINNNWVYDVPATTAPATVRRTETHWGTGSTVTQYREGQTVTHEAVFTGQLGAAGQADNDWHVIWQLHGPFKDGTWRGPAMGINVRNGELRIGGGAGHADHSWTGRNYEWTRIIGRWTDGRPTRVKVQTYLSSDPAKGWVSVWVDGQQVLNQWRPTSYKGGLKPGTFYPGMDYVVSRNGLYRGTQNSTPPTYRQIVAVQLVRAG